MVPVEDVVSMILTRVEESEGRKIGGGRLSELLKHHFPNLNLAAFGVRNLRAFIRENLSGRLYEVGQLGTDIVYGLSGAESNIAPARRQVMTQDVQRVFRSPNAPFDLQVNRASGEVKIVAKGKPSLDPWVYLKSPSHDAHLRIARDFAGELSENLRTPLVRILDENHENWWPKFSIYVQERNLYTHWQRYRNRSLSALLEAELNKLGVAVPQMVESLQPNSPRISSRPPAHSGIAKADLVLDDLRDAILRVIKGLPEPALRSLSLPAGELYDALKRND